MTIKDRLHEFRRKGKIKGSFRTSLVAAFTLKPSDRKSTVEQYQVDVIRTRLLDDLLEQIEEVRIGIQELIDDAREIEVHHKSILSKPVPDKKSKEKLDLLTDAFKPKCVTTKQQLAVLEQRTIEENSYDILIIDRIRTNHHSFMVMELNDIMHDYQLSQEAYREKCLGRIKRQFQISNVHYKDDEVEHLIDAGDFSVLSHDILVGAKESREVLNDVKARHNDILRLERSLGELHDIFVDMAMLVEKQGEKIDKIEVTVQIAKEYVEKGQEHLEAAAELQLNNQKQKFWIMFGVAAFFFVIVGGVLLIFGFI